MCQLPLTTSSIDGLLPSKYNAYGLQCSNTQAYTDMRARTQAQTHMENNYNISIDKHKYLSCLKTHA